MTATTLFTCLSCAQHQEQGEQWGLSGPPAERYELPSSIRAHTSRDLITLRPLTLATRALHRYAELTGELPSSELIDFTLHAYGVPLWGAELRAWSRSPGHAQREARRALILSSRGLEDQSFAQYFGESSVEQPRHWGHLTVSAPALLRLQSTPRSAHHAQHEREVSFTLPSALTTPKALLLDESGALTPVPVIPGEGAGAWRVLLPAPHSGAPQELELLARSTFGLRPLTQLTFHAGPLPTEWSPNPKLTEPDVGSPQRKLRAWLAEQVNAARARHQLPALTIDPQLNQLAQRHAREMRDAAYFGHRSPHHGSPIQRLRSVGYVSLKVGENIARNSTLAGAHHSLLRSLGHRRNMLDPEVTRMGVGVLRHEGGYLITQLYVRPAPVYRVSDLPELTAQLYQKAQLSAPSPIKLCTTDRAALCSALRDALSHLERLDTDTLRRPVTPEGLIAHSAQHLKAKRITAWVAYSDALEALKLPQRLLTEGSTLALSVRLYWPKNARQARLEVWGLSSSAPP